MTEKILLLTYNEFFTNLKSSPTEVPLLFWRCPSWPPVCRSPSQQTAAPVPPSQLLYFWEDDKFMFLMRTWHNINPPEWGLLHIDYYLWPMLTDTRLSRFRRHHCSTSDVQVALKKALRTLEPEQARKTVASCSLKPVLPPSNSLSDSSTTSHSTLNTNKRQQSISQYVGRIFWLTFESLLLLFDSWERRKGEVTRGQRGAWTTKHD